MFVKQYDQCFDIHLHQNHLVEEFILIDIKILICLYLEGIPSTSGGLAGGGASKPGFSDKIRKQKCVNNY